MPMGIAIGAAWLWFGVIVPRFTPHIDKKPPSTIALAITAAILLVILLAMIGFIWIVFKYLLPVIGIELGKPASNAATAAIAVTEKKLKPRSGWKTFGKIVISCWIILFLIYTVFPWAMRTWWPSRIQSSGPTILSVHEGTTCRDAETGNRIIVDDEKVSPPPTDIYIDAYPGCDTLVVIPTAYGYHWFFEPADDPNAHRYVYLKDQGATHYQLLDLASSNNAKVNVNSLRIFFQSAEPGGTKIHIFTDQKPMTLERVANNSAVPQNGGLVTEPVPIVVAKAECTEEARLASFSGNAYFDLVVDENGNATDITIALSTGISSEDAKMMEAVRKYKFRPAMQNGHAVPFSIKKIEVQLAESCHE